MLVYARPAQAQKGEFPKYLVTASRGHRNIRMMSLSTTWEKYLKIPVLYTETGGSTVTLPMMQNGKVDITNCHSRDIDVAYHGTQEYQKKGKLDQIRMMSAAKGRSAFLFVTVPRTGITKIEDIAGKRVIYTERRSVVIGQLGVAALEYYGLLDKVKEVKGLTVTEKYSALAEGRLDVSLDTPLNFGKLLQSNPKIVILPISEECGNYVLKKLPWAKVRVVPEGYMKFPIPKGARGVTIGSGGVICRAELNNYTVYQCVKTMHEHFDELMKMYVRFRDYNIKHAVNPNVTVPYHPGAIKYFKEKGLWTSDMDKVQKRLLAK
jgi:TRAP transporter TAXI family solute receptor